MLIDTILDLIMEKILGEFVSYSSADSINLPEDGTIKQPQLYSPEFLRSLRIPELSPSELLAIEGKRQMIL
jgi:hypothetical protein